MRLPRLHRRTQTLILLAFLVLGLPGQRAAAQGGPEPRRPSDQELIPHGQDRAPNAPRSPERAREAMTVPSGFRVELVASEPDIVNPVAMTFDERGRIWITESLEYPRREAGPGRDRVKVLEDSDGDGKADRFTIFADGLNIPSGIAVGHGGVWVANSPDILFMQDRDGDGQADSREVVATGFGRDDTHELPNSLTWGPDGWLYGWNGVFNPSKVASKNGKNYSFTCAIFRIHPRTRIFELWCEGTSNPWGIAIDRAGSFFASACVIDHLWHLVETGYYIRQGGPYPAYAWPIGSIVDHTHQKAAYCGIHYFDSAAYPPEYRNRLYMGNIHGNCINADSLEKNGSTYRASPAPDFLQANDAWFMPVSQKTGPDGCLYILDWYDRYHCYQDANRDPAGIDRLKGRLYRVRYKDAPRRASVDLARATVAELTGLLGSPNVYERDIAQRLLSERAGPPTRRALEALVLDASENRTARMHGLWALIGGGALETGFHLRLLSHPDPAYRAWGIRAAGNMGNVAPEVREAALAMARDASPDVRLQVAIAARKLDGAQAVKVLLDVLTAGPDDPLIPHVVWQNLHPLLEGGSRRYAEVITRAGLKGHPGVARLMPRLIDRLLAEGEPGLALIAGITKSLIESGDTRAIGPARAAMETLGTRIQSGEISKLGLAAARDLLAPVAGRILSGPPADPMYGETVLLAAAWGDASALRIAESQSRRSELDGPFRLRILSTLIAAGSESVWDTLAGILKNTQRESVDVRGGVLDLLARLDNSNVAPLVLAHYAGMEPELQPRAIELLSERPIWSKALLAAVAHKQIPSGALSVTQLRKLQRSRDAEVARAVKALWGTIREDRNPERERVVARMRSLIRATPGDPVLGQGVFNKLCAQCHKIYGSGQDVGPDLTANGRNDFEQLLSNVFDCNLVVGPGYRATTIVTHDGRLLSGLLSEEGKDRVVLKLQGGKIETVPRSQIDEMKTSAVSLMPDDVEKQLGAQEIADLFAFLCLDKPPSNPTARPMKGAGPISSRPHQAGSSH
jgi:putative heme-binding domain-containing protein